MTVRGFWALWAAVVLAALVWMLSDSTTPAPPTPAAAPMAAPLPTLPGATNDPAAHLAALAASTMWGPRAAQAAAGAASAATVVPEPAWVLSGTYAQGSQRVLLVHFEGQTKPPLQLRVGDRLPDGARLRAIESDRVLIQPPAGPSRRSAKPQWLPVNRGLPVPDN